MVPACLLVFALFSCADLQPRPPADTAVKNRSDQLQLDLTADQLVEFAGEFTRLNAADRLGECHKLKQSYSGSRRLSELLRLFSAQIVTDGCGSLAQSSRVIHAFSGQIPEKRLRDLLAYQLLFAERNLAGTAERLRLGRRLELARSNFRKALSESKQALSSSKQALSKQREALSEREEARTQTKELYRQMVSRDAEARQLKEKLDALKSIEQDLNDTER